MGLFGDKSRITSSSLDEKLGAQRKRRMSIIHDDLPEDLSIILAKDRDPRVRKKLAYDKSATPDVLQLLAADKEPSVRVCVADNPNTPIERLLDLIEDDEYNVKCCAYLNLKKKIDGIYDCIKKYGLLFEEKNSPTLRNEYKLFDYETIIENLAKHGNFDVRTRIADMRLPYRAIDVLAKDYCISVREAIASNPYVSQEALSRLSADNEAEVRHAVATNPNTPLCLLRKLTKDFEGYVREAAHHSLKNTEIDEHNRSKVGKDPTPEVGKDPTPESDEDLRMWCMEHPSRYLRFFDRYKLLSEAKGKDRELLKFCISHENSHSFRSLDEALEWIKTGVTPDWVPAMYEEFDKIASHKTKETNEIIP